MNILALDAATERCSVALMADERVIERAVDTQRGHADLILPMVEAVLAEAGMELRAVEAVAYGRGPGAFTGVRIAVGVAQGIAYGLDVPTMGVSTLAAVAQQVAEPNRQILVCMDARMGEVYWALFECSADGLLRPASEERVSRPEDVVSGGASVCAGTGFRAYPALAERVQGEIHPDMLPRAREIALLAAPELRAGRGAPAAEAAPVYVRDQVVAKK